MNTHNVKFKRRSAGVTNYKKRFNLLKSDAPRLVVRVTGKKIIAHISKFDTAGDKTLVFVSSEKLKDFGWKNSVKSIPAAYLTGLFAAKSAKDCGINSCVSDFGIKPLTGGSRLFAALKGAIDGGLAIPHSAEKFPKDDRISGKHIEAHRKTGIEKEFSEAKSKIMSGKFELKKKETAAKEKKEKNVK